MSHRLPAPAQTLRSVALCYRQPLARGQRGTWQAQNQRTSELSKRHWSTASKPRARRGQRDPRIARLEAVLLLAREPLGPRKLGRLASLADGTEARTLVRRLNETYDHLGSAFRVEEVAGGYQLLTRPKFASWLRRLYPSQAETRLSGPALETLAIVAYRQPTVRAEIEAVRGVQCGEMLRQLMERELVRIVGRSEELGRPYLYGTTRRFLEVFGLRDLDELPRAEILRVRSSAAAAGLLAASASSTSSTSFSHHSGSEEEFEVKKLADPELVLEDPTERRAAGVVVLETLRPALDLRAEDDDEDDFDDEEDDDDDLDDDEDDDLDDEEDDDDLDDEDDDWEEVDDDDELEEEDEEEEEDDDWDDDEDDEDDDWDDDEDDEDDDEEEWEEEGE